jgi:RNA polymerase sigma factor (sigma-70 family)
MQETHASAGVKPLINHLFRHEAGKLVAVLTRIFGPRNLELAEDVVQDTLLKALEHWKFHGIPNNPTAWLFTAARNKALDVVRRERYQKEFAEDLSVLLKSEYSAGATLQQVLQENEIQDEQLRMMFVCCHPSLAAEGQVALILKTLCGFSVTEIANAFLTNEETISKRLYRARQQFRQENIPFRIPSPDDLPGRIDNVLTAIYLLFNEGYNSSTHDLVIREDLVEESLRLGNVLVQHPATRLPKALALLALLCFHAARLYGRIDDDQHLLTLRHQNRSRWNQGLIRQGMVFLTEASVDGELSSYHIEASIALEHCLAPDFASTNWKNILALYDVLYALRPDAIVALNRSIVVAELEGPRAGLEALDRIPDLDALENYYLLPATRADFLTRLGDHHGAREHIEKALTQTNSPAERQLLQKKFVLPAVNGRPEIQCQKE